MATDLILVIDDHALFRSGVAAMLSTAFQGIEIVGCSSLSEAFATVTRDPTVVLLDLQLPGRSGLDGMGLIVQRWPSARIVVISADDLPATVEAAHARGAAAFLSKAEPPGQMLLVLRGMLETVVSSRDGRDLSFPALTVRQTEVLGLAGQGLTNKMIGRRLGLSEHTVRGHMQALLAALGVARRTEAIFKARQLGIIQ